MNYDPFVRLKNKEVFLTPDKFSTIKDKIKSKDRRRSYNWETMIAHVYTRTRILWSSHATTEDFLEYIILNTVGYLPIEYQDYTDRTGILIEAIDYDIHKSFLNLPCNFIDGDFLQEERSRYFSLDLVDYYENTRADIYVFKR